VGNLYQTDALSFRTILILVISAFSVSCGGGAKVIKEPQQIETTKPLASAKNKEISVDLDWIIVSNGPGSWAQNAYWDEYLISVHNPLSQALFITEVAVFDSTGHRILPLSNRKKLVKGSKKTIRRYKDSDVDVHPGMGAGQLLATGGAVTVTGVGIVYAAASTVAPYGGASAGASGAAVLGVGMVLAGPVIAVAAIKRASNNSEVNEEIKSRQTKLPIDVDAASSEALHLFFPIAVSPSHLIVSYEIAGRPSQLTIDTRRELTGLHLNTVSNGFFEAVQESE
jgi:Na+-transporting methylmalonyl-CoA/oxaloacetate decarboxylase gamma subunit